MIEEKETKNILKSLSNWWLEAGIDLPYDFNTPLKNQDDKSPKHSHAYKQSMSDPLFVHSSARKNKPHLNLDSYKDVSSKNILFETRKTAAQAETLTALKTAINQLEIGELSLTAKQAVFARGNPKAEIMIIGEAPGYEEDRQGKPFVGRSGQLIDKMFQAIQLREKDLYISNIVNWRPPNNRTPSLEEIQFCLPLIERHIALIAPKILVLAGSVSAQALLNTTQGITKIRGRWFKYIQKQSDGTESKINIPAIPIYHPAYLLRRPQAKKEAWHDLLMIQKKIQEPSAPSM